MLSRDDRRPSLHFSLSGTSNEGSAALILAGEKFQGLSLVTSLFTLITLSRGPAYRMPMPLFFISVQLIETSILIRYGLLLLTGEESRLSLRYVGGFDRVVFLRVSVLHRTLVWLV
jgi:hypothetical protein